MTNETLALYSNVALSSAMFVFTISMVCFAVDLARTAPRAMPTRQVSREPAMAPAGRVTEAVGVRGGGGGGSADPGDGPVRVRKAAGVALATFRLGTMVLLASVLLRGLSVQRAPWGNMFEFSTTGALAVCLTFTVLSARRDLRWLGLFVAGPVLLTLGLALAVYYTEASQLMPSLESVWLIIHVSVAILAVALFTIAFSVVILSLLTSSWESSDRPLSRAQARVSAALPDSRTLDRTAYGLHVVAFPMWTFTLIAGAIWAEQAWGRYWNWDPKEVWTFVIWVVYAAYLHARATTGWSARRGNYIALAGYGCILVNFMVVNVFFVGQHSYSGM